MKYHGHSTHRYRLPPADQVFFKNPLPYLLARETDIMVSGDCHNHGDASPQEKFPPINNNIGFVYFRWA